MLEWVERVVFAAVMVVGLRMVLRRSGRGSPAGPSWPAVRDAALGRDGTERCVAFWGAIVLGLNVVRILVRELVPGAGPGPTTGLVGGAFLLLKDFAQGAAVIVACMAARPAWRRRIVEAVPAVSPSLLVWIGVLAASGLIHEAGALAAHRGDAGYQAEAAWEPLTTRLAVVMLASLGPTIPSVVAHVAWWVHVAAVLGIAKHTGKSPVAADSLTIGQD